MTGELHVGHVETRHDEQDQCEASQGAEGAEQPRIVAGAGSLLGSGQRMNAEDLAWVLHGAIALEAARDPGQRARCGLRRDALSQPPDYEQVVPDAFLLRACFRRHVVCQEPFGPHGNPEQGSECDGRAREARGRDADDRKGAGIHPDSAAQHVLPAAELAPGRFADDCHRSSAPRPLFLRREAASRRQANAERREVVAGDEARFCPTGGVRIGQDDPDVAMRHHLIEDAGLVPDGRVLGVREPAVRIGRFRVANVDADRAATLIRSGKGLEEQHVDQPEHGGVRTDAKRHHRDRRERECRRLREEAKPVPNVAGHRIEPRRRPAGTDRLLHLLDSAEFNPRLSERRLRACSRGDLLLGEQLQVAGDLTVKVAVDRPAAGEAVEDTKAAGPCSHGVLPLWHPRTS